MSAASSRLAIPALLVANAALACGPWLVRLAGTESGIGPVAAAFWRLALAVPVLAILALRLERPRLRAGPFAIVVVSGLTFALDLALWHVGILHTRLANSTLLGNIAALIFPLYGFWLAKAWPDLRQWLAMALAAVGMMLLLGRSYQLSADHLVGDLACIGAGLCYCVYLVGADHALGRVPPLTLLAVSAVAGLPVLAIGSSLLGEPFWPRDWTAPILLTLGSQLIGQGLLLYGVARVQPIIVGLMLLSQPAIAAAIGWIRYGERLTPGDAIGALAIGLAVMLVRGAAKPVRLPPTEGALNSAT